MNVRIVSMVLCSSIFFGLQGMEFSQKEEFAYKKLKRMYQCPRCFGYTPTNEQKHECLFELLGDKQVKINGKQYLLLNHYFEQFAKMLVKCKLCKTVMPEDTITMIDHLDDHHADML